MASASRLTRLLCPAGWLLLLAPCLAWGLTSDRSQPIQIEADRATLDEKTGLSVYEGNVFMQQGTLTLRGSRMSVQLRDSQVDTIIIDGKPARFSQRPDGADTDQQAEADHIEYHTGDQRLILQGHAMIRQSGKEEFSSNRIIFNLRNNTVNAGGGSKGSRVRITLQPDAVPDIAPDTANDAVPDAAPQVTPPGNPVVSPP
ncbi:MAG TPA: lipopolysaccharide transport periplasmic protein LptA [Gammaproteobacteria bacterium]|nr:lipopolysaccharide transport periplasmic protein LptA [Gammaproteobacteria bacterium]